MEQKYVGLIVLAVILIVIIIALIIWWAISIGQTSESGECVQENNINIVPDCVQPVVDDDGIPYLPDDEPAKPEIEQIKSAKTSRSQVLAFEGQKMIRNEAPSGDQLYIKEENDFLIHMGRRGKGTLIMEATPMLFDDCLKTSRANREAKMATYDTEKKMCALYSSIDGYDKDIGYITLTKNN